eukprot:CAMPEP_0177631690 /NCGR_PEP_ID=MMETSP0447-20121125/1883_1 /TAXON_ID=0 /ORGANISM="Stygamoeba regulata, Strain BSH-02190019" /LENGTH=67 /DNA_ID=CAMNT_0019133189 /DNA_START=95 /DNA_END=295 /DNA_ORIENTATION=+
MAHAPHFSRQPGVVQCLVGGQAQVGVHREQAHQQVCQVVRDIVRYYDVTSNRAGSILALGLPRKGEL